MNPTLSGADPLAPCTCAQPEANNRSQRSLATVGSQSGPGWWGLWWRTKSAVFRFLFLFALLMASYFGATLTTGFKTTFFPWYAHLSAEISNVLLNLLGQSTTVSGTEISSPGFSVTIASGCDGIAPLVIFISAVLSFPRPFRTKIAGLLFGALFLWAANFVRIVSLFLIGLYYPAGFDLFHEDVWQSLFILLSIVCWAIWLRQTQPTYPPALNAPG